MIRPAPMPQRLVIGSFLFLAAVACAVAPLPLAVRSSGVLLATYLAFGVAGSPLAFAAALLAPAAGLIGGDREWLVMLPIITSSNLLAVVGLEYGWRYPALLVSPLLQAIPQIFVSFMSGQELFAVALPWDPDPLGWIGLHVLIALAGALTAVYLDRRRERRTEAD